MSYSISTLFGNYYAGSSTNQYSSFYSSLSEYSSIKSGAYGKLLKSYYAENASSKTQKSDSSDVNSKINQNLATKKQKLSAVEDDAKDFKEVASKLTETDSSKSLFSKVSNVDDDIVSAVKDYVSAYNSLVDSGKSSQTSTVTDRMNNLTNQTSIYTNSLSKIGISIESDKSLKIDEDVLKSADVNDVKKLFNGAGSMASMESMKAASVESAAQLAAGASSLYGSSGAFYSNMSSSFNWFM